MAEKTTAELLAEAVIIRDETEANANTALRVGQHLYNNIESLGGTGNKAFTGQVKGGSATIAFSATASFNMDNGNTQKMVVTAAVTSLAIINKIPGSSYLIILEIGGTGSYAIPQAGATLGDRTTNSVDDSAVDWHPTTVGSKIRYDITVEPDGDTHYSIETLTI